MQASKIKKFKRGDTFVEVCFALAIFSFIAVLAISAMNHNLSTVQSTLESEVSRSEVDAQAEAIRYIHEAYVGGRSTGDNDALISAWGIIADNALSESEAKELSNKWPPSTCSAFYKNNPYLSHMMVINTRRLNSDSGSDIIVTGNKASIFSEAPVIPRLVYNNQVNESLTTNSNVDLSGAEGIWFYAVKGDDFYDIYIQSCWYTGDSSTPRALDTVIRLYDPEISENLTYTGTVDYEITYDANGGVFSNGKTTYVMDWAGTANGFQPPTNGLPEVKYGKLALEGWSMNANSMVNPSYTCTSSNKVNGKCKIRVYAYWQQAYYVHFNDGIDGNTIKGVISNSNNGVINTEVGPQISPQFKPFDKAGTSVPILESHNNYCYKFDGWSRSLGGTKTFDANNINLSTSDRGKLTELYAVWKQAPCGVYKVTLTWGAEPRDLDSHTYVTANGQSEIDTYYGNTYNDLSSATNTVKVQLNYPPGDDTNGLGPEITTITINNLSNFSVRFHVHRYSGSGTISSSGTKVVLTREDGDGNVLDTYTYNCPSSGYGSDWDVFKIVNREVKKAY